MPEKSQLAVAFLKSQPGAAAQILERQDPNAVATFLLGIPAARSGPVIARMLPRYGARLLEEVSAEQSAALLSGLNITVIAAILRHARPETRKRIMPLLAERQRLTLKILLHHAEETVGAWMIPDNLVLPHDCKIAEAIERIAADPQDCGHELILVVDREGLLLGEVTVRMLLAASSEVSVGSLMRRSLHTLRGRSSLVAELNHRGWQSSAALPVVSRDGKLLGVLRHADLQRGLVAMAAAPEPTHEDGILSQIFKAYALSLIALTNTLFATDQR